MTVDANVVAALHGASKRYGKLQALDGVDLDVRRGELLALLGPNGAGKTTAISLLLGLLRADAGTVELFGRDPQDVRARRRIGVMLQHAELPGTLRVGELLRLTASYYPAPRSVAESAELAGVAELLQRPYAELSGGQQRRVPFALALCGRPELLFLDEPTVGMDIEARQNLWTAIRRLLAEGCSVLLTTHYLEEARGECLRYMRSPGFMLPILLFPAMFYLLFGVLMASSNGADAARYLLASYGVFGVMSPGLFGFGVSLALERDGGLLTFKRALPMPPGAYLLGKMVMAMAAAGVVILLLLAARRLHRYG